MELKEKIDIKAGKKKIRKLHDKYAERLLKKKHRGKIKIPETPLKYLKLPKEFILLDAPGALCQEQKRQHNCVSSYIGRIEKGSCIIYSADINGEHVTIETCDNRNQIQKNKRKIYFYRASVPKNVE